MEVDFATVTSDQATNREIARTQPLVQRRKFGVGLDDDALPAALIESGRLEKADSDVSRRQCQTDDSGRVHGGLYADLVVS
jgi:hypothetical protein